MDFEIIIISGIILTSIYLYWIISDKKMEVEI